ncbi:MAG: hypothetical protein HY843_02565, partial [Bdellovibrio sp.]|nr:hypothetical protein [Bdellovibrio sp.]
RIKEFRSHTQFGLPDPQDYNLKLSITNPACKIEYLAIWRDIWSDRHHELIIDQSIYEHLGNTDKSAFWIHEALYKAGRENLSIKNSDGIRELIGYLFAEENIDEYKVRDLIYKNVSNESNVVVDGYGNYFNILRIPYQYQTSSLEIKLSVISGTDKSDDAYAYTWSSVLYNYDISFGIYREKGYFSDDSFIKKIYQIGPEISSGDELSSIHIGKKICKLSTQKVKVEITVGHKVVYESIIDFGNMGRTVLYFRIRR